MKVLVEIFEYYGIEGARKLYKQYVTEDSSEAREEVVEDCGGSYYDSKKFINGEEDRTFWKLRGDWDDPAAFEIIITPPEKFKQRIEREYQDSKDNYSKLFGEEY